MTSTSTVSKKASRNSVPGPAEIEAAKQLTESTKQNPNGRYTPPKNRTIPAHLRRTHPVLKDPKERLNEMLVFTPANAKLILEGWNGCNRPFMEQSCRRVADDMREGRFMADNGESISFDTNGDLISGQHRLAAIVRTGVTMKLLVVSGLPPEVRHTVDTGVSRTLTQILAMQHQPHADTVGRAARMLIAYEDASFNYRYSDIPPNAQPTKTEIQAYIDEHSDELNRAAATLLDKPYRNPFIRSGGVNCFFLVLFARQNQELAKLFMYQLASGAKSPADTAGLDSTHPVFVLRNTLFVNRNSQRRLPTSHVVAITLKAWVAVRDKRSIKMLAIRSNEAFPDIDQGYTPAGGDQ